MRAAGGGGAAEAGVAAYHQADGVQVSQVFWSDPAAPEVQPTLSADDLARKTDAFAAYASQTDVMSHFFPDREAYRLAPVYDFTHPPPPGACLYDGFAWALKSDAWRTRAASSAGTAAEQR